MKKLLTITACMFLSLGSLNLQAASQKADPATPSKFYIELPRDENWSTGYGRQIIEARPFTYYFTPTFSREELEVVAPKSFKWPQVNAELYVECDGPATQNELSYNDYKALIKRLAPNNYSVKASIARDNIATAKKNISNTLQNYGLSSWDAMKLAYDKLDLEKPKSTDEILTKLTKYMSQSEAQDFMNGVFVPGLVQQLITATNFKESK